MFSQNSEVDMQWVIDKKTMYPKIGIIPSGHSAKTGLLLSGNKIDDNKPQWKGFDKKSSVTAFQSVELTSQKTERNNSINSKSNPFELAMNGPYLSIPVRDMPYDDIIREKQSGNEINPPRHGDLFDKFGKRHGTTEPKSPDSLAPKSQQNPSGFLTPATIRNFAGQSNASGVYPPDIEGAVGVDYYVQMVNSTFAIYNKNDGTIAQAPRNTNTLWASHGGRCQSDNSGDAIALYDEAAQRWVLTQFAVAGTPRSVCFAISQTPDPTGAYYTYDLVTARYPDYYKLGVWPTSGQNAYYMGTNSGQQGQYDIYALDRENMLLGLPARSSQFFQSYPNLIMPADVDGDTPPPANAPGLMYSFRDAGASYFGNPANDSIDVYEFDIDWDVPSNTTFTLEQVITNAFGGLVDFNWTVCGFFQTNCLPQQGTAVLIDSGSWWPQQRLQYRNFGGFETLVGTWTVNAVVSPAKHAAPRWFELRRDIGVPTWTLRQQGTFAPDADNRFSPSISMDASENIALAYSTTSASSFPSIKYTVHDESVDATGFMETEAVLIAGGGSQTGSVGRWGDYSSMEVDPVDDCTFWFTSEYYASTSSVNWVTRIASFKIPSCVNYSIQAVSDSISVCKANNTGNFDLTLSSSYLATTNMTVAGCPAGATCNYSTDPVIFPATTTSLNLSNLSAATGGTHVLTATATDSVDPLATTDRLLTLNLQSAAPSTPSLSSPANDTFVTSLIPSLAWSSVSDQQDFLVEIDDNNDFSSIDFTTTTSGLSTTATSLAPETCYYWRVAPSNLCGSGLTSSVSQFYTGASQITATSMSTDVPQVISTSAVTVTSTLTISGVGILSDVNLIDLDIKHTYVSDLTIKLTSPQGTEVTIMNVGCTTNDDISLSLDDEAAAGAWPCTPVPVGQGGTYQPSNPMSSFDGEDANGVWTLTVTDAFDLDGGSIDAWGLNFEIFTDTGNHCSVSNNPAVANNDAASLNEDSGANTLNVLLNDNDPENDPFVITAKTDGSNGIVAITNGGTDLSYTPTGDYCGSDSFTYTITGNSTATVSIDVNCVNDQPSFSSDENIYISLSDLGSLPAEKLACNFVFGPANESSQAVNDFDVQIVSDTSGIISAIDVLDDGMLSYSFTGNTGVATVSVALQDDGGLDFGGVDTSTIHQFNVYVQDYIFKEGFEFETCQ